MTPTPPIRRLLWTLLAVTSLLLAACGEDSSNGSNGSSDPADASDTTAAADDQPVVVASTSWVAAFVRAAGVSEVSVVAPSDLQHPPDYDPRPSDLATVADADYVVLAGFEGFAERLTEAAGSDAELITITAENEPDNVRRQVMELAETFGTTDAAEQWWSGAEQRIEDLRAEIEAALPDPVPTAVAHVFMAGWADFAGIEVVGTYGPAPVTATELAELADARPDLLFANAHVPAGATFADLGATQIDIVNFPDESLELIWVFETNAAAIIEVLEAP